MRVHVYKDGNLYSMENYLTTNTYSVSLNAQGTWVVYVQAYDNAGNKTPANKNFNSWDSQTYVIITEACTRHQSCGCERYNAWKDAGRKCGPGNKTGAAHKYSSCIYQGNGCHGTNPYYCIYQTRTCALYKCC